MAKKTQEQIMGEDRAKRHLSRSWTMVRDLKKDEYDLKHSGNTDSYLLRRIRQEIRYEEMRRW